MYREENRYIKKEIFDVLTVKTSVNNLNNDVNFEHLIEHALFCTLERVHKDVSYTGGLRFGTFDIGCLVEATRKGESVASLNRSS